jgi:hypothetical protein
VVVKERVAPENDFFTQDFIPQFICSGTAGLFHEVSVCRLDCLSSYLRISTVYNKFFFPLVCSGMGTALK